mgnify:CR=1 FL=1
MNTLLALVLASSPAHADTVKEVPGLGSPGARIVVMAPLVAVEVVCSGGDKAKATLSGAPPTLKLEGKPEGNGAEFSVSGTGSGSLKVELPADVKLEVKGLDKTVKVRECQGTVGIRGSMESFDLNVPKADITIKVDKGGLTKPSVVTASNSISMTMPDISAKITGNSISMTMPDIAPYQGKEPKNLTVVLGAGAPDVNLKAAQSIVVTN